MRKGFGVTCVVLGILCLVGAVGLVLYNRWESAQAEKTARSMVTDVRSTIQENAQKQTLPGQPAQAPDAPPEAAEQRIGEMATVAVDGYDCIGILSVPVLELELPVLTQWSYAKLRKAPCLYYGSYYESDFVIAAHNYNSHFGRLSELQAGDVVVFTDVNGTDHVYEVVLQETLPKEATREMIASGFDLSLYTCTLGGGSRVTVRCTSLDRQ